MGMCDSSNKAEKKLINQEPITPTSKYHKNQEDDNSNNIDTHPSSNSDKDNKSPSNQEIKNSKCPQLTRYEYKKSEFSHTNNNTQSIFSSGLTEEEIIIRGEVNKKYKNKDEDFDNNSFKKLVQDNGGIILKNIDQNSNISSSQGIGPIFDFGKETLSEIKSKHSFPFKYNNRNNINNAKGYGTNNNLVRNNKSENNKNIITKKNKKSFNKNLGDSTKINVSMQDNYLYLNIPKIDEPFPDIDELSEKCPINNIKRKSSISQENANY